MSSMKEIFEAIDADGSGFVDKKELIAMVKGCNDAGLIDPKLSESEVETAAKVSLHYV